MRNQDQSRVPVGAVMVGADGEVYCVPGQDQAAFQIPGPVPRAAPEPGGVPAEARIREDIQAGMDHLPQMASRLC